LFIAIPFAKIYCVEVFSEDRKTPLGDSYRKKFPKLQAVFAAKSSRISVCFAAVHPFPHLALAKASNHHDSIRGGRRGSELDH
jgi:hypothetical protein